jgi:hypothetical protein
VFPRTDRRAATALLIPRFLLGIFLLQWSVEKLILPSATARIAPSFYGLPLPIEASYALRIAELTLSLGLLFDAYGTFSCGLSLLVHKIRWRLAGASCSTHMIWPYGWRMSAITFGSPDADPGAFCCPLLAS